MPHSRRGHGFRQRGFLPLRDVGGLSDRDIARATGAGVSTVGSWMRRTRAPGGVRAERLAEPSAVVERLSRVIDTEYITVWLRKPVPALGDEKPLDVVARGDYKRLSRSMTEPESPPLSRAPSGSRRLAPRIFGASSLDTSSHEPAKVPGLVA